MKTRFFTQPLFFLIGTLGCMSTISAQHDNRISTIDYVQILNNNKEEVVYYYQNNWKVLREMAIQNGYIDSFQILELDPEEGLTFQLMLITTYPDKSKYDLREDHFAKLIKEKGELKLLNDKKPADFRKTSFSSEEVRHWN